MSTTIYKGNGVQLTRYGSAGGPAIQLDAGWAYVGDLRVEQLKEIRGGIDAAIASLEEFAPRRPAAAPLVTDPETAATVREAVAVVSANPELAAMLFDRATLEKLEALARGRRAAEWLNGGKE